MNASDMVALMTFSSSLELVEDFTDDREKLIEAIQALPIGEMAGMPGEDPESADDLSEEDANVLFMADDTEFNIFNTDRRLSALEAATRHLSTMPEKKALVYFSSGVGKTGVENQSQLRATINEAQRANVVFYTIDARGLIASAPGGDATTAAKRGSGIFSGKTQRDRMMKVQRRAGHALLARRRHGRQGAARRERPHARHHPGPEGSVQLLHPGLLQHQRRPGRPLPPHPRAPGRRARNSSSITAPATTPTNSSRTSTPPTRSASSRKPCNWATPRPNFRWPSRSTTSA